MAKERKPRSTKEETDRRIFTVQGWIIARVPDYLILKQCIDQWGVTERQAKNYKSKAYQIWHDANEATIEQKRQFQIDKLKQDQRSLKEIYKGTPAGIRATLAVDKEIHRLEGMHAGKKLMIGGDPDNPVIPDTESRDERLATLLAKALEGGDPRIVNLLKGLKK